LNRPDAGPVGALPHSNGRRFTGLVARGPSSVLSDTMAPTTTAARTARMTTAAYGLMRKARRLWHKGPPFQTAGSGRIGAVERCFDASAASLLTPHEMDVPELRSDLDGLIRDAWGRDAAIREIAALAGDASSRRYFRVHLAGSAPATAVLMVQSGSG